MNGNFIQVNQRVLNLDAVSHIDLAYPREQAGGGAGTCVRVWFIQAASAFAGQPNTPPSYVDFLGNDAQALRRHFSKMADTGQLTVIVEHKTDTETRPTAKTAAAKG